MAYAHHWPSKSSCAMGREEGIHGVPSQDTQARRNRHGRRVKRTETKVTRPFVLHQSIGNLTIKACGCACINHTRRQQNERMSVRVFIEPVAQCPSACEGLGPIFGPPKSWRRYGCQPRSLETHPQSRRRGLRYRNRSLRRMSGSRCRLRKQAAQPVKHRMTIELIPMNLV
jgi:hypothetical protein